MTTSFFWQHIMLSEIRRSHEAIQIEDGCFVSNLAMTRQPSKSTCAGGTMYEKIDITDELFDPADLSDGEIHFAVKNLKLKFKSTHFRISLCNY